jgi:UDP-2,3-diacylglucosamine pyrophosphatase LpxH
MTARGVAFVGDAHLLAGDEATRAFVAFLERAPGRFERLVLVGDIFDLWIARPHLHEAHHDLVLEALAQARARGLAIDYAVGNRDYAVESLARAPFDRVALELLVAGDSGWIAEHGDLVNDADAQYRAWRRFSRSRPVLHGFLALPGAVSRPLAAWLERRMRTTNLQYKRRFPIEAARHHASRVLGETGARYLVLGHFHQELRFPVDGGEVLVLPDWKRARRHALWLPAADGGTFTFEPSL